MTIRILLAVAGLLLLTLAADHLVLGASQLAHRLRIRPVVVGVVVIGLGTSAPELLVSGVAAARGDTSIALGNITGSNILNLTMVLGVAALVAKVTVRSTVVYREARLAVSAVVLFGLLAWTGLTVVTGAVLLLAAAGALWLLVRWAGGGQAHTLLGDVVDHVDGDAITRDDPGGQTDPAQRQLPAWSEPVRTVLGLAGVLAGAQLLVVNAAAIATDLGVPQLVIGITLVAVGTSLPELVTTIQAQRHGESDLLVGNLFGSNLFNSLVGGAVIAFAAPTSVPGTNIALVVVMSLTALTAWALLRRSFSLTRREGSVLLAAYVLTMPLLL